MARHLLITWALVSTIIAWLAEIVIGRTAAEFSNNTKSLYAQTPMEAKPSRRLTECLDISPPSWHYLHTCDAQLKKSKKCEYRRNGLLDDGICAKTCGVCSDNDPDYSDFREPVASQFGGFSSAHFIAVISSRKCELEPCGRTEMTRMLTRHRCVHNFNNLFGGFVHSADAPFCTVEGFRVLGSYLGQYWNAYDHVDDSGTIRGLNYTDPIITLERLYASACKNLDYIYAARKEPLCGSRCAIAFNIFESQLRWPTTKRILMDERTAMIIMEPDPAITECRQLNANKSFDRSKCPKKAGHEYLHEHRKWYSRLLSLTQYRPMLYLQSADFFKNKALHVHRVLRKAGLHTRRRMMCPRGQFSPPVVCDLVHFNVDDSSCTEKWF